MRPNRHARAPFGLRADLLSEYSICTANPLTGTGHLSGPVSQSPEHHVDDFYADDGGLRVLLEQYRASPGHAEPLCRTEEELRQALVELGARE